MKNLGFVEQILGMHISQKSGVISIDVCRYIKDLLKEFGMNNCRSVTTVTLTMLRTNATAARLLDLSAAAPMQLTLPIPLAVTVYEDNQGCLALAENLVLHQRTKHIDVRYDIVRENSDAFGGTRILELV